MANSPFNSSGPLPPAGPPPEEGLGYSRHYAKKIRDMGRSSKESWIKKLWNHMFKKKEEPNMSPPSSSSPEGREGAGRSNRNTKLPPIKGGPGGSTPREGTSSRDGTRSAPAVRPPGGKKLQSLPVQLADSPYLPARERSKYTIVPNDKNGTHREHTRADLNRSNPRHREHRDHRDRDNDNRESKDSHRDSHRDQWDHDTYNTSSNNKPPVKSPTKRNKDPYAPKEHHGSNRNLSYVKASDPGPFMKKARHPYLSTHADNWKPKTTRGVNMINLEKRAKATAERAIKVTHYIKRGNSLRVILYVLPTRSLFIIISVLIWLVIIQDHCSAKVKGAIDLSDESRSMT